MIAHPPDWTAQRRADADGTVAFFGPPGDESVRVHVRAQPTDANALPPLAQFVGAYAGKGDTIEVLESEETRCNAIPAIRMVYRQETADGGKTASPFVLLWKGKLFMVPAHAPSASSDTHADTFDRMDDSFAPYVDS